MEKKEDIKKELESLAPRLSEMDKKEGFQVPGGYFDTLPDQVFQRIEDDEAKEADKGSKVLTLSRVALWRAAAVLVVAVVGISIYLQVFQDTAEPDWASLTEQERNAYVLQNIDEFETQMIVESVQTDELNYDLLPESFTDEEELDQYLDDMLQDMELEEIEQLL